MSGNKEQIDVSLIGNDKIEEAIVNIQKAPTEEKFSVFRLGTSL